MTTTPPSLATLVARFPLATVTLPLADQLWQITCVVDQDALLDGVSEVEHVPYGFLLWESAIALAQLLQTRRAELAGKRILELGAGVGFAGVVAQHLGATVWQTDHRADLLVLAAANAAQNQVAPPHQFLADWRTWDHTPRYDYILGADILYERAMHRHLLPIFRQNLAPSGQLLLTDPSRPQALELLAQLESDGWHVEIAIQPITLPLPQRINKPANVALLTCTPPIKTY
ncbi:MAG: methyltransferase domain-containing protein [Caldilineaceae bacterium]|nr:methyltransferase domain-containing protein [Caldilineaceae bacterium]